MKHKLIYFDESLNQELYTPCRRIVQKKMKHRPIVSFVKGSGIEISFELRDRVLHQECIHIHIHIHISAHSYINIYNSETCTYTYAYTQTHTHNTSYKLTGNNNVVTTFITNKSQEVISHTNICDIKNKNRYAPFVDSNKTSLLLSSLFLVLVLTTFSALSWKR